MYTVYNYIYVFAELNLCVFFLNIRDVSISWKQALRIHGCSKDQSKFCSRSNRPTVDEAAVVAYEIYAWTARCYCRPRQVDITHLDILFILHGLFHWKRRELQVKIRSASAVDLMMVCCILQKANSSSPTWLHAWANLIYIWAK